MGKKERKEENKTKEKTKWNKIKSFFQISWRKSLIILVVWIIFIVLHNLYYIYANSSDALKNVFSFIAVAIIPIYFLIILIYSSILAVRKKRKLSKYTIIALIAGFIGGILLANITRFNGIFSFVVFFLLVSLITYYLVSFLKIKI